MLLHWQPPMMLHWQPPMMLYLQPTFAWPPSIQPPRPAPAHLATGVLVFLGFLEEHQTYDKGH
jgi:hypothetical protein